MKKLIAFLLAMVISVSCLSVFVSAEVNSIQAWNGESPSGFFDAGNTSSVAVRLVVCGTGTLTRISPFMAGDADASFDMKIYAWNQNYATTVKGTPVSDLGRKDMGENVWNSFTNYIDIPDGGVPAGEYLIVMGNFQNISWAIRNSYFPSVAGIKVYENGIAKDNCSIQWLLEFSDKDTAYDATAVFTDVESEPDQLAPVATWGETIPGLERYDGNSLTNNKSVALRFAFTGSGKLWAFNPYMAGSDGTFNIKIYNWLGDYKATIASSPVKDLGIITQKNENFVEFKTTIHIPGGIPAGEYLIVADNFSTNNWAICSYFKDASSGFSSYKDGVQYTGMTLYWQLLFSQTNTSIDTENTFTEKNIFTPATVDEDQVGVDGGYIAETADAVEKTGVLAFSTAIDNQVLTAYGKNATMFGMYVYSEDTATNPVTIQTASISDLIENNGIFNVIVQGISINNFNDCVYVIPYVVSNGVTVTGKCMVATVNQFAGNWLGSSIN